MSTCPFCNLDPATDSVATNPSASSRSTALLRRAWRNIQWLFPAALLVLMPKCPLCVAAYVALFTGVGITVSTARWIQVVMLVLCLTSVAYLAARCWRRRAPRYRA
jgi:hypothetical protein